MKSQWVNRKTVLVFRKPGNEPKPNVKSSTLSCSLGALFSWESKSGRRLPTGWGLLHGLWSAIFTTTGEQISHSEWENTVLRGWRGLKYNSSTQKTVSQKSIRDLCPPVSVIKTIYLYVLITKLSLWSLRRSILGE